MTDSERVVHSDDDFDQSEESERRQAWKHFDKYTSNFYRAGFREAVSAENSDEMSILQEAFDSGYSTAFVVSKMFGKLRGTLALTIGIYEEGRLDCQPEQLESLKSMYAELMDSQNKFLSFVDDQQVFAEVENGLESGKFTNAEQLNSFWNDKVRQVFDTSNFETRLRVILKEMNCPRDP